MNKAEFVEKLSQELDTTKTEATKSLDAVLKCIAQSLKANNNLKFVGFGTFKVKKVEAREMKVPNGKLVKVPAHKRVTFSVGKEFKDVVSGR